jgi:hypothetical protein
MEAEYGQDMDEVLLSIQAEDGDQESPDSETGDHSPDSVTLVEDSSAFTESDLN